MNSRFVMGKIILEALLSLCLLAIPFICLITFSHSLYFPVGTIVRPAGGAYFIFPTVVCFINVMVVGFSIYYAVRLKKSTLLGIGFLASLLPNLAITPLIIFNYFWSPLLFSLSQGIVFYLLLTRLSNFLSSAKGINCFIWRNKWNRLVQSGRRNYRLPTYLAWLIVLLLGSWFAIFQWNQLNSMQLGFSDIGYSYFQFKSILQGEGILLYFEHFVPSSALPVIIFAFYPHLGFFIVAQSLYAAIICLSVFFYSRFILNNSWLALGCALVAAFMPSISQYSYKFSYGYCLETMAVSLFILAVMLWEKKRYLLFLLVALFTSMLKESMIIFFISMGLIEFIFPHQNRPRRIPILLLCISLTIFILVSCHA